jgi:hypothetical protein
MSEETTSPVVEEELVSTEAQGVVDEANAQGDDQTDGEQTEGQEPDEDTEEIEYEGKTFKAPKGLKDALLRQDDYTRKTQTLAEERRALAAHQQELSQQAEARAATHDKRVELGLIDRQLAAYQEMDWQQYSQTYGADAVAAATAQWRTLESQRGQLNTEITEAENSHRLSSERVVATVLQEAERQLSAEVQGFGPDLVRSVAETAGKFGFTGDELRDSFIGSDGKPDTRAFRILARLHAAETELAAEKAKNTKAQTAQKQAQVQPAKTVGQNAGQYKPGLDDSLPPDEWVRRRNAQLAKAG